jgi:hypothetical protein
VLNTIPNPARQILEHTLHNVQLRANSNGECFGGEISDAMREAGTALGADRLEVLLTRSVLTRTMESLGEEYPTEVLEDYEHRMPISAAIKYLRAAIDETPLPKESANR